MAESVPERRDIATRIQPGNNRPPSMGGGLHARGPDRRPRRLLRNVLLAALAAEGPITVEVKGPRGGIKKKTIWGRQAAVHSLLVAVQQIARQGNQNVGAVLRLMELIAQEVDGRPMAPAEGGVQRKTTFVYEGQEESEAEAPTPVADVVDGAVSAGPDDEPFERMEP